MVRTYLNKYLIDKNSQSNRLETNEKNERW